MTFDVGHVIYLLLQKFNVSIPDDPKISRQETKIAVHFASVIEQSIDGYVDVEEQDQLIVEEDGDWDIEEFKAFDDVLPSLSDIKFGEKFVTRDEIQEAVDYYRQPGRGCRPLSVMTSRFRWILNETHLKKLRQFEKQKQDFKDTRTNLLKFLSCRMYEVVKEKLENGVTLHDRDLMMIARDLNQKETKIEEFSASQSWISRWKRSHRIVSRRITKFITRKCFLNKDAIDKSAEDFVEVSRREMSSFLPSQIFNADQTGIVKELHGARSLSFLGVKDVERIVQAKSSLTHSFTLLPMLFQDGTLGEKAYMVMAEPSGEFPASRPIPDCPNLVVRAGKTHIMTKESMKDWLRTCVFIPSNPKKMFMLIDSWSSFKDHTAIKSCVPRGFDVTIRNIPPHTTGIIQPLDAHWNGPFKNLLKKFTTYILNFRPDFLIAKRNNEILMTSLLYHQMSAEYFKPFLRYSWKKTGYVDSCDDFETPAAFCYGDGVGLQNCFKRGCTELSCLHCARCKCYVCFDHCLVLEHHLCKNK